MGRARHRRIDVEPEMAKFAIHRQRYGSSRNECDEDFDSGLGLSGGGLNTARLNKSQ